MKFNKKNILFGKNVQLGKNVRIGDNCTIYDNVTIGDNTVIANDTVIGEPLSEYYYSEVYENPKTEIGSNVLMRSHSVIYASTKIGNHTVTGHRITVREKTTIGNHCQIGSYNDIQGTCEIGNYSKFHSYVNIGQYSKIGSYVFIYPYVVLTNDPTPPSNHLIGPKIDDFSQITSGSIIMPGTEIGKYSLVGANSTVSGQFKDNSFINGNPAKRVGDLDKMPFFNESGKRHYPWPENFSRNMPWEKTNFKDWSK